MKRLTLFILAAILVLGTSVVALANGYEEAPEGKIPHNVIEALIDPNGTGAPNLPAKPYDDKERAILRERLAELDAFMNTPSPMQILDGRYFSNRLNLSKQITTWYCGPASVQIALSGHYVSVPASSAYLKYRQSDSNTQLYTSPQVTIANAMAFVPPSSTVVKNAMNYFQSDNDYTAEKVTTQAQLLARVKFSLSRDWGSILLIRPYKLNAYGGNTAWNSGHYVVAQAHDMNRNTITVMDCNYDSRFYGSHEETTSAVLTAMTTDISDYNIVW